MLCRDCTHRRSKQTGYISSISYCGFIGDKGKEKGGIGIYPWVKRPHPKCPIKHKLKENDVKMAVDNNATKVITGKVRLSYAHVFEPASVDGGDEKYSTAILIPKSDKVTLQKIKAATDAAKELGKSKWPNGKVPVGYKTPLRDGDEERPDDETYAGCYFLNASSKNKPGIAKPIGKGADGKTKFQEITDTTEVYSGCYAKVSLNFYPFDAKGNRGVAAGLNNIVKVQDGDFLGGRSNVSDDFSNEEFDTDDGDDYLS